MTLPDYIIQLNKRLKTGISGEHSYRGDLQNLIESLVADIMVTNEPARIACGAPDYIITRKNIPVGYIEAKDLGTDLSGKAFKDQFDRYRQSLNNLIITDYLQFHLYIDGTFVTSVVVGELKGRKIEAIPESFDSFISLIRNFCLFSGQTIKSASKLAGMMAAKARLLANVIEKALDPSSDASEMKESGSLNLQDQYESFRQILIHDITPRSFADIYAQTIAYGMFAARLNDPSLESFSRQEAAELIPRSNPFLRKLFQYVAGYDLDDRIRWIVDALADIFRATNVEEMLRDFGKTARRDDPLIHFYETFLSEYDPALRRSRGVWYTPEPVVNFIVRAVDDILKTEFALQQGLADTSKIKIKVPSPGTGKSAEKEVHRVQILDPAACTGTFLAEVVKQIHSRFEGQQGIWSRYVDEHLIPRLNGFEILMASYAIAHLKLDMLLRETGYLPQKEQRLKVYLTNSLEEHHPDTGTLFASWLSTEANEANHIKRDTPVMVVLGNPPYSVSSSNKSNWIESLLADYKKDLNERNIQPLSDDYIKFIRFGQYLVEKNGEGILAFITNNSFIDGIIHRQMRKSLIEAFDKIFVLDLHGNAKKKESAPDGGKDENVFDIMQGVSITILVKSKAKKNGELSQILHYDLFGKRIQKYNFLSDETIKSIKWDNLKCEKKNYFFVVKEFKDLFKYEKYFGIDELFKVNGVGIVSSNDNVLISNTESDLKRKIESFYETPFDETLVEKIAYRLFDERFIYYDVNIVDRARYKIMRHLLIPNLALVVPKQAIKGFQHAFVVSKICDKNLIDSAGQFGAGNVFPLFLKSQKDQMEINGADSIPIPNLDLAILEKIENKTALKFGLEASRYKYFSPVDILDYIYAILHSPTYRSKYKEFLKIDFPRIPYPKNAETFWKYVSYGSELRQIHLLESSAVNKFTTDYSVSGSDEVCKVSYSDKKVWINDTQYFDNVSQGAWEFFIGGYQPAQKWLKDRKGRLLSYEDILHYQKIIVALNETGRIMSEIGSLEF